MKPQAHRKPGMYRSALEGVLRLGAALLFVAGFWILAVFAVIIFGGAAS